MIPARNVQTCIATYLVSGFIHIIIVPNHCGILTALFTNLFIE